MDTVGCDDWGVWVVADATGVGLAWSNDNKLTTLKITLKITLSALDNADSVRQRLSASVKVSALSSPVFDQQRCVTKAL